MSLRNTEGLEHARLSQCSLPVLGRIPSRRLRPSAMQARLLFRPQSRRAPPSGGRWESPGASLTCSPMGTGFLPQLTQPRAWGPSPFTRLPKGTQVSRCCLESSGRNSGQHWTRGAPFQPGLRFSLGTGHKGRRGSHLILENWVPDPFLKKQPVLWETVGLLSFPERETGQESSSRTSPEVSSWHPQQGAWHAGSQELFPCSEVDSPPMLDAEGPGGSPPPALVPQSATQEGGSASDPRRLRVPGVSPQRAIRTFWRPQPPKDSPYHRELKFGAEHVGTYFSPRPPTTTLGLAGSVWSPAPCPLPLPHPRAWLFGWRSSFS